MAVKSVSIRFEQEMLDKISYIADFQGRSINSHMLILARDDIAKHEAEHGKIEGKVKPVDNVKPAGRS